MGVGVCYTHPSYQRQTPPGQTITLHRHPLSPWADTPWADTPPLGQTPPPPWADTPLGRHLPDRHPLGRHPPAQCMLGYTHSPAQFMLGYTPPCPMHAGIHILPLPPPAETTDTVNKRVVRIPVECILVR